MRTTYTPPPPIKLAKPDNYQDRYSEAKVIFAGRNFTEFRKPDGSTFTEHHKPKPRIKRYRDDD